MIHYIVEQERETT